MSKTGNFLSERLKNLLADADLSIHSVGSSAVLYRQSVNPAVPSTSLFHMSTGAV